jgi:hypothetical protein
VLDLRLIVHELTDAQLVWLGQQVLETPDPDMTMTEAVHWIVRASRVVDVQGNEHDESGRFTSKGGGGDGTTLEHFTAMDPGTRRDEFKKLDPAVRDKLADAPHSVQHRVDELLSSVPKAPEAANAGALVAARVEQIHGAGLVTDQAAVLIAQTSDRMVDALTRAGVDDDLVQKMALHMTDTLAATEIESMGRVLGDHGIRHEEGNGRVGLEIMNVIPTLEVTPPLEALATIIGAYHDIGYLTPPGQVFLDPDHPHWSEQAFQSSPMYGYLTQAFGKPTADDVSNIIATHDATEIDWQNDPFRSAMRLADNLALFHNEKLPALCEYVPDNTRVLVSLGRGEVDVPAAQKEMHANIEKADLPDPVKERLHHAADEVNPSLPKFTLGMLGARLGKIDWETDHVNVDLVRTPANDALQKVLDMGQIQFAKFAKQYGEDPEKLFKQGYLEFDENGHVVLSARLERVLRAAVGPEIWQRLIDASGNEHDSHGMFTSKGAGDSAELEAKAIAEFGTTENIWEAGYVTPSGKMLDFSEGHAGSRYRDHSHLKGLVPGREFGVSGDGPSTTTNFMAAGFVRCYVRNRELGFEVSKPMPSGQLERVVDEAKNWTGNMRIVGNINGVGNISYATEDAPALRPEAAVRSVNRWLNDPTILPLEGGQVVVQTANGWQILDHEGKQRAVEQRVLDAYGNEHGQHGMFAKKGDSSDGATADVAAAAAVLGTAPMSRAGSTKATKWFAEHQAEYESNRQFHLAADALTHYTQGGYDEIRKAAIAASEGKPFMDDRLVKDDSADGGYTKKMVDVGSTWNMEPQPPRKPSDADAEPYPYFTGGKTENIMDLGLALNQAIAVAPPIDAPLYRGQFTDFQLRPILGPDGQRLTWDDTIVKDADGNPKRESYGGGWERIPGTIENYLPFEVPKVGDVVDMKGPVSFSMNEAIANNFADVKGAAMGAANDGVRARYKDGPPPLRILYEVEPGARGLVAAPFSPWGQSEVTSQGRFEVTRVEKLEVSTRRWPNEVPYPYGAGDRNDPVYAAKLAAHQKGEEESNRKTEEQLGKYRVWLKQIGVFDAATD